MPKPVLIPLPEIDFDPTESAIPWKILTERAFEIRFATPEGLPAQCDRRMLTGEGLGFLKPILMAAKCARDAYSMMEQSEEFKNPLRWNEVRVCDYGGLILPGGHASGMKIYLESKTLQEKTAEFFESNKPVGAICHGVVLAARSQIKGMSVLHTRKTTALLASQELSAWILTAAWLGRYYRTYNQTVESEVISILSAPEHFLKGPLPILRDDPTHLHRGFTVRDGNYLSARWPGDAHLFANEFIELL